MQTYSKYGFRLKIKYDEQLEQEQLKESDQEKGQEQPEQPVWGDIVDTVDLDELKKMSKEELRELFMKSFGNMRIDEQATKDMRERSRL